MSIIEASKQVTERRSVMPHEPWSAALSSRTKEVEGLLLKERECQLKERCETTGQRVNTDSNQTGMGHHMNVKHVCWCVQV